MSELGPALLSNAVCATLLAGVAWAVGRWTGRPKLTHLLWLLVLVRLVAPPVVTVSVLSGAGFSGGDDLPTVARPPLEGAPPVSGARTPLEARPDAIRRDATAPRTPDPRPGHDLGDGLAVIWLLGASAAGALGTLRSLRFARALRRARDASEAIAERARAAATRLDLPRPPRVSILDARVPPMVWSVFCRARIVLPRALIAQLDDDELDGILAHECAHIARRDHWTRYLELAIATMWWWFPVAWWARTALRRAEEECSDALAVGATLGGRDAYASGLLRTVTWLAGPARGTPPVAVGLSPLTNLRRRIDMILHPSETPAAGPRARGSLTVLALVVILVHPSTAQEDPRSPPPLERAQRARRKLQRNLEELLAVVSAPNPRDDATITLIEETNALIESRIATLKVRRIEAPGNQALRRKLAETVINLDFDGTLEAALQKLGHQYAVEFVLDPDVAEAKAVDPVSFGLRDVALGTALRLILESVELQSFVQDGVIHVVARPARTDAERSPEHAALLQALRVERRRLRQEFLDLSARLNAVMGSGPTPEGSRVLKENVVLRVIDASGQPLAGVQASHLVDAATGTPIDSSRRSAPDGRLAFGLEAGRYRMRFDDASGRVLAEYQFTVEAGRKVELEVVLPRR